MGSALCAVVLAVFLSAGCTEDPAEQAHGGQITAPHFREPKLFIRTGFYWPSSGEQLVDHSVATDGSFEVALDVHHVTAFVDTNGNRRLDAYNEPSSRCSLVSDLWNCHILPRSLTAHSLELVPVPHDEDPEARFEGFSIIAEQYDQQGRFDTSTTFCIGGEDNCAEMVRETFGPAQSKDYRIGPCKTQRVLDQGEAMTLRATGSDGPDEEYVLLPPEQMGLHVKARRNAAGIMVLASTKRPMTHAIVWLGSADARRIAWSTETAPGSMWFSQTRLRVRVPDRELEGCEDCKLMVQVANVEAGPVTRVAEARAAIGDIGQ